MEALRSLISEAAVVEDGDNVKVIEIDDVSRAFFEAPAKRDICVELPMEAKTQKDIDNDCVGHLNKSLYGTRDAAMNFQEEPMFVLASDLEGTNPCARRRLRERR